MTRHTATTRSSKAKLVLEVQVDRDETSGYRHQWTTTARLGLLSPSSACGSGSEASIRPGH